MKLVLLFISTLLFLSCKSGQENNESKDNDSYKSSKLEKAYDKIIEKIESNDTLGIVNSLFYTKEDGSSYEVQAYFDQNKQFQKIIETKVEGKEANYGKIYFYFLDGVKIASREMFEDKTDSNNTGFIERITYYNEKNQALNSKMRKSKLEDGIEFLDFAKTTTVNQSETEALDALNQRGLFSTNFQGFVVTGNQRFLTIGSDLKNGYMSALMIQYEDSNIAKLIKKEKEMIGTPLEIGFEQTSDPSGFEFQVLMFVKILNK